MLSRFDHWLAGNVFDRYFHGWPNLPKYKDCFCFKWEQAGTLYRLYGFLCHPKRTDSRFQACILVLHAQKADATNFTLLDIVNQIKDMPAVVRATETAFRDY